jgi:hypothetical protein
LVPKDKVRWHKRKNYKCIYLYIFSFGYWHKTHIRV